MKGKHKYQINYVIPVPESEARRIVEESKAPRQNRGRHCKQCDFTRYHRITDPKLGPIWVCARCFEVTHRVSHAQREDGLDVKGLEFSSLVSLGEVVTKCDRQGQTPDAWVSGLDLNGQIMRNLIKRKLVEVCYRPTSAGRQVVKAWRASKLPVDGHFE